MTQHYIAGELSLLLGELQAVMTNEASLAEVAHLRLRAESGPRSALVSVAVRALEVADRLCWDSLTRGDAAFIRQAAVCAELWEFAVCAGLLEERQVLNAGLGQDRADATQRGIPQTGTENFGGATVTAGGLVFCAGTKDSKIRAFDKQTGRELWQHKLPFGGYAPPAIYEVGGRQFVVIGATGGGKLGGEMGDAYVAFALPE